MARIRALRRLLWRAALLACISFLLTAASIAGTANLYADSAALLSPALIEFTTALTRVRSVDL